MSRLRGEQRHERAQTFAPAPHRVGYVTFDSGVKSGRLLGDAGFDPAELSANHSGHSGQRIIRLGRGRGRVRRYFHLERIEGRLAGCQKEQPKKW